MKSIFALESLVIGPQNHRRLSDFLMTIGRTTSDRCSTLVFSLLIMLLILGETTGAQINPGSTFQPLFTFPQQQGVPPYPQGGFPLGSLVETSPRVFVGTATEGGSSTACGSNGCGVVYQLDVTTNTPTETVVHSFVSTDGSSPKGTLAWDGKYVYGTTKTGGTGAACPGGCGTIYRIKPDGTGFMTLYSFQGGSEGATPVSGVILDKLGNLYGTTPFGGDAQGDGTLFELVKPLTPQTPTFTIFGGAPGARPNAVMQATDGKFYGSSSSGILFSFDPVTSTLSAVITGLPESPQGRLAQGADGALYGATRKSPTGLGTVFRAEVIGVPPSWKVIHQFAGAPDGYFPEAGLLAGSDGMLYGTAAGSGGGNCSGNDGACGTVFRITASAGDTLTVLHYMKQNGDGADPEAELTEGSDGSVYGTNFDFGMSSPAGAIFSFGESSVPNWSLQFGSTGVTDIATTVATDAGGRVYIGGNTGSNLGGSGSGDLFIGRFNPDETPDSHWASPTGSNATGFLQFGSGNVDGLTRIALDSKGNVYAAGYTTGNLFGTNQGQSDIWVASFDTNGTLRWSSQFGTSQIDEALDLTLDSKGTVYVTGFTTGNLGGNRIGSQDAFLAIVAPGKIPVVFQWGVPGEVRYARKLSFCKKGASHIYVAGDDQNSDSAWLSSFNPASITAGIVANQTLQGNANNVFRESVLATDSGCNAYLGGNFQDVPGSAQFFYLQKYDPLLAGKLWETDGPRETVPNLDVPTAVTVDGLNQVYVAGSTGNRLFELTFSGNPGDADGWFAAFDSSTGTYLPKSAREVGTTNNATNTTIFQAIAIDATGTIYGAGNTNGSMGGGPPDPIFFDAFLLQYPPYAPAGSRTPTSISLTNVPNPSVVGQPVNLTATVSAPVGVPTGKVKFVLDGVVSLASKSLNGGIASTPCPARLLKVGTHTFTAIYLGNSSYWNSQVSATQTVTP